MPSMTNDQADIPLTVTLPAWMWRGVLYAVEAMVEDRRAAGYDKIAESYRQKGIALANALHVDGSGDLPYVNVAYDEGRKSG